MIPATGLPLALEAPDRGCLTRCSAARFGGASWFLHSGSLLVEWTPPRARAYMVQNTRRRNDPLTRMRAVRVLLQRLTHSVLSHGFGFLHGGGRLHGLATARS